MPRELPFLPGLITMVSIVDSEVDIAGYRVPAKGELEINLDALRDLRRARVYKACLSAHNGNLLKIKGLNDEAPKIESVTPPAELEETKVETKVEETKLEAKPEETKAPETPKAVVPPVVKAAEPVKTSKPK